MKQEKSKKISLLDNILSDFSVQNWSLNDRTISRVTSSWQTFYCLLILDWFLCNLVIAPLGVAFWRGTWDYSNKYLDQQWCGGDLTKSNLIAGGLGLISTFIIDVWYHDMDKAAGLPGTARHTLISRLFSVMWGLLDIALWKGLWDGVDHLAGNHWSIPAVTLALGVTPLILTGTLRSALSFPHGICVDHPPDHIHSCTFLQSTKKNGISYQLLDGFISRCLEIAVILTWHGVWTLTDVLTHHLSETETAFFSLVIGWSLSLIVFLGQFPLLILSSRDVSWLVGRVANILYTLLGIYSTINCFRAYWYLMDLYLMLDGTGKATVESQVIGQVVGALALMVLGCSTCLHAGIYKDSFEEGVTLAYYFTSYFYVRDINSEEKIENREKSYSAIPNNDVDIIEGDNNGNAIHV